jgi:hypothetical protein
MSLVDAMFNGPGPLQGASTPCAANLAAPRWIEWISDIEETRAAADLCDSWSGKVAGSGIKRRGAADLE